MLRLYVDLGVLFQTPNRQVTVIWRTLNFRNVLLSDSQTGKRYALLWFESCFACVWLSWMGAMFVFNVVYELFALSLFGIAFDDPLKGDGVKLLPYLFYFSICSVSGGNLISVCSIESICPEFYL